MKNKYQATPSLPLQTQVDKCQVKWGQSNYLLSIRGRKYLVYLLCGIAFQIIFFLIFFCFKWDRSGKQSYFNIFLGGIEDWHICSGTDNSGIINLKILMASWFYPFYLTPILRAYHLLFPIFSNFTFFPTMRRPGFISYWTEFKRKHYLKVISIKSLN